MNQIEVINSRVNNLKNVSVNIPKHQITVFTGRSGSGKSSLLFNTIAYESNRLLNETYSSHIQYQLPQYNKPDVDEIRNLPVSIIIDQKRLGGNSRSTVGTISDIYSTVRLLYSRMAEPFVGYSNVYSFNNKEGMCTTCDGLGFIDDIDIDELIHWDRSLNEDAINFPSFKPDSWRGKRYLYSGLFDNDKPIKDYSEDELNNFLYSPQRTLKDAPKKWPKTAKFEGLVVRFRRNFLLNENFENKRFKKDIDRVVTQKKCPECQGQRLNHEVLRATINGMNIMDFCELSIYDAIQCVKTLHHKEAQHVIDRLYDQLIRLEEIGLGYLSLSRETNTLSGGESQRLKLVKHLNSALSDIVYIIDEPSVGLHPQDIIKINAIIQSLKDKGNTVLIVEHDPDVIRIADYVIDLGPYAGSEGGEIMYSGAYESLLNARNDTASALTKKHKLNDSPRTSKQHTTLTNVTKHNLKIEHINIPTDVFTVVTGVAGSGKSTLIVDVLPKHLEQSIVINQKAVTQSSRSNLLTYLDIFDEVRTFFSNRTDLSKGYFSYNSKGACPKCNGKGVIKTELAFMGNSEHRCEECNGLRYNKTTLSTYVDGYNISNILHMTASKAIDFFEGYDKIIHTLQQLNVTGLGYMTLGQTLDTLSGGELQRLKLSQHLLKATTPSTFIFDEPTTGLHEQDIPVLMDCFKMMIEKGHGIIVIEHNLSIMTEADWLIDIGPAAGQRGGQIMVEGLLQDVIDDKESVTMKHLRRYISQA